MNKAVSLVRISSQSQSELYGGTGIEFQSKKLSDYCQLMDLELVDIIVDIASGGLADRDGITKLKGMIEANQVDKVLVWNTSRAFRSMVHFAKFYEFLKNSDVELISVGEGIRSSSKEGEMIFGIMASISAYEKTLINERMMSGKKTKYAKGERGFGGRLPFGYVKKNDDIVIDSLNGKCVDYIFKTFNRLSKKNLSKTKRTQKMLKLLGKNGFDFNGKPFKAHNIKQILKNKFYVGDMGKDSVKHIYPTLVSRRLFNSINA